MDPTTDIGAFCLALATAQAESGNPQEQWVHLLPAGRFAGRDGRGPWSLSDPAAVIEASRRYAGNRLMPVDYEHQTDYAPENGQPAPAAGWIKGLQARADGIWGLVNWTGPALARLGAKEYRYLSPVFNHTPAGQVTRILRAALTNNPALDQLTALARAGNTMPNDQLLSQLWELLGLPPEADATAVLDKIRALTTAAPAQCGAVPDPARYVPIGTFQATAAELQALKRQTDEQVAARAVDELIAGAHILPHWRDWAVAFCRSNKPAFDQFVQEVSPLFRALRGTQTGGVRPPETRPDLAEDQLSICRALGHSVEDVAKYGDK